MVDNDFLPWCNPPEQPHDQDTYLVTKDVIQQASEASTEGWTGVDANNYVDEWLDTINTITSKSYKVFEEQMKKKILDVSTIARDLSPKPL